jgi:hypothetical protein
MDFIESRQAQQQAVFNLALQGIRSQRRVSQGARNTKGINSCLYRAPCGAKCAIGHLIPDSHYCSSFDTAVNASVVGLLKGSVRFRNALKAGGVDVGTVTTYFLRDLQEAHDSATIYFSKFETAMRSLAYAYGLVYEEKVV